MTSVQKSSRKKYKIRQRYRNLRRAIGANILHVRLSQDMDLQTLSDTSGLRVSRLDQYEAGRMNISLQNIASIATALNVPPERLLDPDYAKKSKSMPRRE